MNTFITFLKHTRAELTHVTWLESKQVALYSLAVIILSIVIAYMLGGFDLVLQQGLTRLLAL